MPPAAVKKVGLPAAVDPGKTGVDFQGLKNQIGIITHPRMVIIDTNYLSTLPENEYRSGYAEMLKHGIIRDKNYFEQLSQYKSPENSDIEDYILVLNSLDDKVVSPVEINKICKKLKNSRVIEFKQAKHEIFMEKDVYRKIMWREIDNYFHKLGI